MTLQLDRVSLTLGTRRIGPVSIEVPPGEIIGLTGPSGVGKTTVARIAAGLVAPDSGRRTLAGTQTRRWGWAAPPDQRRRVQLVAQHPHLAFDPRRTLAESLTVPARLHSFPAGDPVEWADRCRVDQSLLGRRPGQVSGGQLQRCALARALAVAPDHLIVDEVTTAQDAITTIAVTEVLRTVAASGTGVLLITHDTAMIDRLATGTVAMSADDRSGGQ